MKVLSEGTANVLYEASQQRQVFYNPAMETNRDISIAMVNVFVNILKKESENSKKRIAPEDQLADQNRKGIRILEALSATGLRSIRYARELPPEFVHSIVANDLDEAAVAAISRNVKFNFLQTEVTKSEGEQTTPPPVLPNRANASTFMNESKEHRFHVIDIDPYGTPSIFLDSAVQAVTDGGLLCVTATDMPVLCGKYPETCFAKYGATSLKGGNCHEMALRVLIGCIERHATQYKRTIVPLVSLSVDYYVRVFVRVYTSASEVKKSASKMGYVVQCSSCSSHEVFPMMKLVETKTKKGGTSLKYKLGAIPTVSECQHCKGQCLQVTGPAWIDPLFDHDVLQQLMDHLTEKKDSYNSYSRLFGLLTAMSSEIHVPLLYSVSRLSKIIHVSTPPLGSVKAALINAGYTVSGSHTDPTAIKTNAPNEFIWDIYKAFEKTHPVKKQSETSPSARILSTPAKHVIDFTIPKGKEMEIGSSRQRRRNKEDFVPTFLPPPTANWGPKARATGFKRNSQPEADPETMAEDGENSDQKRQRVE